MITIIPNALNLYNTQQINALYNAENQTVNELASGTTSSVPDLNPSTDAVATRMTSQSNGDAVAASNIEEGLSLISTADSALSSINTQLTAMRNLMVQADNGTNSTSDLSSIQSQINEILQNINQTTNTTSYNQMLLFQLTNPSNVVTSSFTNTNPSVAQVVNVLNTGNFNDTVSVSALAQAMQVSGSAQASSANALGLTGTFTLDGTAFSVTSGESLSSIASAINSAGIQVTASVNSNNQLVLTSDQTGSGSTITASDNTTNQNTYASSNTSVATVNTLDANTNWSQAITVNQLASNEIVTGTKSFTSTTTPLNIAGSFTLNGHSFSVTDTNTISDIVNMINGANIGITASVNASGDMVLSSNATGTANAITASDATTTTSYALASDNTSVLTGSYDTNTTPGQWQIAVQSLVSPGASTNDTNYASDPNDNNWASVATDQSAITASVNGSNQTVQDLSGPPPANPEYGVLNTTNTNLGSNAQPSEVTVYYENNGADTGGPSSYSGEMTFYGSTAISDTTNAITSFYDNQYGYFMFKTSGGNLVHTGTTFPTSGFNQINMYFNWSNDTVQYAFNGNMINGGTAYAFQTAQTSINAFAIHNAATDPSNQDAEFSDLTSSTNGTNMSYTVNGGSAQTSPTDIGTPTTGITFQATGTGTTTLHNVYNGPILQYLGLANTNDALNVTQTAQNASYTVNGGAAISSGSNTVTLTDSSGQALGSISLVGTGSTTISNSQTNAVLQTIGVLNSSGGFATVDQTGTNNLYSVNGTSFSSASNQNVNINGDATVNFLGTGSTTLTNTTSASSGSSNSGTVILHTGNAATDTMNVTINHVNTSILGINQITTTQAQSSISQLDQAIAQVSNMQTQLGAYTMQLQERLDNLSTQGVDLQSAISKMTDTNMAQAMSAQVKQQILLQSAASVSKMIDSNEQSLLKIVS